MTCPHSQKPRTILKVKEKKIRTILNPDSYAVSELQQGRGKEQEGQNVKRVNRRVWVTQKCFEFYVDIWPQVYWPDTLTLSSAQGRWPEGMMNRSSSASATDLTPHHTLQLSAK